MPLPDDLNDWKSEDFKQAFNNINENKKRKLQQSESEINIEQIHEYLENMKDSNEIH